MRRKIHCRLSRQQSLWMQDWAYTRSFALEGTATGALLVFDEMITGFRFARGGAQELFGITPDLSTLGKGLANGYPLSAITGRADVMKLMEEVFFSFTMGGETLSLAAALAARGVPGPLWAGANLVTTRSK